MRAAVFESLMWLGLMRSTPNVCLLLSAGQHLGAVLAYSAPVACPLAGWAEPGHSLPIPFTTESGSVSAEMAGFTSLVHCAASHGEGEITGPRSAVAEYQFTGCVTEKGSSTKCKSASANNEEEIATGKIDAELVFINQAKHEVGVLLDPGGGT